MRFLLVAALLSACSGKYDSQLLGLTWEPPSGVKLVEETAALARFTEGVEIRSIAGDLELPDEKSVEVFLPEVAKLSGITVPEGPPASAKLGTLPLGAVARFEVKIAPDRMLVYVVPLAGRFLVVTMKAPVGTYGKQEAQLERSLASLRLRK